MNRDGYIYSIVFTFLLTAFFTAVLAITQASFLPANTRNEENVQQRAIAKVLGIEGEDLTEVFAQQVTQQLVGETPVYTVYNQDGTPKGHAFLLSGQGLWGSIRGYIGLSASFDQLLGIEFVEQNETPGLGGRIDEAWFKDQFSGLPVTPGTPINYGDGLDAITGATSSSNAVLRIVNDTLRDIFALQEVMAP